MSRCYLKEYDEAIQTGQVRVSERLQAEIEQLVDDIESGAWVYDTKEAHRRLKFQESFVKQSKGGYVGKKIKLQLWQKAFWECVYSFKSKETGRRRFNIVLLMVGRKNGKSTLCASDCLYDLLLGKGQEIVVVSNTEKESKLIWQEVDNIRIQIDPQGELTGRNLTEIYNKKSFNRVFRLTSNMRHLDGQNLAKVYYDEAHETLNDDLFQACMRGMSAQDEPLMIITTTQGFIRDGFLDKQVQHAHEVMDGYVEDTAFLPWLYEMDTEAEVWEDSEAWQKANPGLGSIKKVEFLDQMVDRARWSAEDKAHLLTKDFNISQIGSQSFFTETQLSYPQNTICIEDNQTSRLGIGACDLSRTTDVTCASYLYEDNGKLITFQHYWVPKTKLTESTDTGAGARYEEWQKAGYLTVCDGAEVDHQDVAQWFGYLRDNGFDVLIVGHDRWQSREFCQVLDGMGIAHEPIGQGYALSTALYRLYDELHAQTIEWGGNSMTTWMLSNLQIKSDGQGAIKPVRGKGQAKIDGAVTIAIAVQTYRQHRHELESERVGVELWD